MTTGKKRLFIILFSILGFILVIIALFFSRINIMLENYTRAKLEALIEKQPGRIYDIKYDSLLIDIYSGNVEVINFSISPRQYILDSLQKNKIPRKFIIDFKMGGFKMDGLEVMDFLVTGDIEVDSLLFSDMEGSVFVNDTLESRNTTTVSDDILSKNFISALLHHVQLGNGSFLWFNTASDTINALSFENFNFEIRELYSDSTMIHSARGVELEALHFSLDHFQNKLVRDYILSSDRLSFNSDENKYTVINAKMLPIEEKVATLNYFELQVNQIDLVGINYDSLVEKDILLVDKVFINEPEFTYIRPPQKLQKDELRFLPAETFKKIPISLFIDSLHIQNGNLNYLKHGYGEPLLSFDISGINMEGYNFSSDTDLMEETKTFVVGGSLLFFKVTPVWMNFTFPMTDPYNSYTIEGTIDTLSAENLNQIIKNTFQMRAVSGTFNKMIFNINGNDTLAQGDFEVDYNDLKLEALEIDDKDFTNTRRRGFSTFLVNTLVKKKNDPARSSFTKGIIYLDRDNHLTFLDFNLSAFLNGLLTSVIPETKSFIVPKEERRSIRQEEREAIREEKEGNTKD